MYKELWLSWEVEVDDIIKEGHIDATSSEIGNQEAAFLSLTETADSHVTGHWVEAGVNNSAADFELFQKLQGEAKNIYD